MITADGRSFRLHGTPDPQVQRVLEPNGRYLVEGDDQAIPPRPTAKTMGPKVKTLCDADHGIHIPVGKGPRPTILILWTPAAQTWLASQSRSTASETQLIVAMMQSAMKGKWFGVYPKLISSQTVNYTETSPKADLNIMTANGIPDVLRLRNQFRADLVMLVGHYPKAQVCGIAWVNEYAASANTQGYGYSVVNVDVDGPSYCDLPVSAVHEIGHNVGMRHDRPNAGNPPFSYNLGYVNIQSRERTTMAYDTQCLALGFSCPVVPVFSSPYHLGRKGAPLGASDAKNMEMLCTPGGSIEHNR